MIFAFLAETLLAGANGVAIRFLNYELAPIWGAGLRFTLAAVLVAGLMAALRLPLPRGKLLGGAMLFGLLQFAGAFGFFHLALVYMQAGVGQTLLALVPLATLLLAVGQRQERLSAAAVVGTLLGLAGIALTFFDPGRDRVPPVALALVLASVLCFAQALVLVRRLPPIHPVALNGVGMVTGALVLLGASALLGETWLIPQQAETLAALAYLVVVGSVIVFLLHVFIAQNWSASRAAYVMVTIPLVAVVLSARLDQEPITASLVFGGLLVIGGVYIGALREAGNPRPAVDSSNLREHEGQ